VRSLIQNIQYEGKIKAGYIGAFFLLLISFLLTLYVNHQLVKNTERVEHTNDVIAKLELMLSRIKDGETGFRGYLVSGDVSYLEPYFGSRKSVDSLYNNIKSLVQDTKTHDHDLENLKKNIQKKYSFVEYSLNSYRITNQKNSLGMLDSFRLSRDVMDEIRKDVASMQRKEKVLLLQRNKNLNTTSDAVQSVAIASIVIAFFLVVFGFSSHLKENKDRMLAEKNVKIHQDELKRRIEELAKANTELLQMRRQEKFAATGRIARTIAHEIRNPLTNINLAAEQLSMDLPKDDENTGFLFEMIARNSNRINQLVSGLLNSTKFSELNFEKVSINELMDETLLQAQDRIQLNNVRLIKKYTDINCEVSVDKEKIKIAFLNIIINALESMEARPNATITIETQSHGDKCLVVICDTGKGMDEESVSRLFEPYFTNKPKGNGLGLTNTQNIILNHKGNINVKSSEGKGTSFSITLHVV
jgi:signal transduction histidine kinase